MEDYSQEFGKPWNNEYWKDGKNKRKPTKEENYKGEGYLIYNNTSFCTQSAEKLKNCLKNKPIFTHVVLIESGKDYKVYVLNKRSLESKV